MNTSQLSRHATRWVGEVAPGLVTPIVRHRLTHPRRLQPHDWERTALGEAQRIEFRFGLSGLRWGNSGPVVLALHGWEGRASQFRVLGQALAQRGRTLLALDAPAHGASPGHVAHPLLFAEALIEVASEVRDVEAVIGHSMGGGAVSYALSQGLSVERAVLMAAPSGYAPVLRAAAAFAGFGPRATRHLLRDVEDHTGLAPERLDVSTGAEGVDIPVLVVHDPADEFVSYGHAQRYVQTLPDARLLEAPGQGHWRVLRDPGTVEQVVSFITRDQRLRQAA